MTFSSAFLHLGAVLALITSASATDLSTQRLTGKWTGIPSSYMLGETPGSMACSSSYIIAGAPHADEGALDVGVVQVFNAVTGAYVRTLRAPGTPAAHRLFGTACVISGKLAIIGEPGSALSALPGRVHVFDLTTGKWLRSIKPQAPYDLPGKEFGASLAVDAEWLIVGQPALDAFNIFPTQGSGTTNNHIGGPTVGADYGRSVAIEGNMILVGAPNADGGRGAAHLWSFSSGVELRKMVPAASLAGDHVGTSVAMQGGWAVLGAPDANGGEGRVHLISISTPAERVLSAAAPQAGDLLGTSVALDGGIIVAGAPETGYQPVLGGHGAVCVFDVSSAQNTPMRTLSLPIPFARFGASVALCGSVVVGGAPRDSAQGGHSGAVLATRHLTRDLPLTPIAVKGGFAPGYADINYQTLGDAWINSAGQVAMISSLTGAGSNGGKDTTVVSTLDDPLRPGNEGKSRYSFSGALLGTLSKPLLNNNTRGFYQSTLTGTGVTSLNNTAWFSFQTTGLSMWLRTGQNLLNATGPVLSSVGQFTQATDVDAAVAAVVLRAGVNGVTEASNSGVWHLASGMGQDILREGTVAPSVSTDALGQFAPRVNSTGARYAVSCAMAGATASNQALLVADYGVAPILVGRKGQPIVGAGGAVFSSFIGESRDRFDSMAYRATLSAPATSANNEAVWRYVHGGASQILLRKGDTVPGLYPLKVARIINYWEANLQTLILVQISGTGVNSSNDVALLVHQYWAPFNNVVAVLLREGEPAPGCNPARIGTISRVEVEPASGQYLVLTTLTGAPTGTEQVLLRGYSYRFSSNSGEQDYRRPVPVLRKGQLFNNQPGKLRSMKLSTASLTASGAGNASLGCSIQFPGIAWFPSNVVLQLQFNNGVKEIVRGIP